LGQLLFVAEFGDAFSHINPKLSVIFHAQNLVSIILHALCSEAAKLSLFNLEKRRYVASLSLFVSI